MGAVGNIRDRNIHEEPSRRVYFPIVQQRPRAGFVLIVHVAGEPDRVASAIRDALGGQDRHLAFELSPVNEFAGRSTAVAVYGLTVGLPAGLVAMRFIQQRLFGVGPSDPLSLAAAIVMLAGMALAASYVPARRASRIAPLDALRAD